MVSIIDLSHIEKASNAIWETLDLDKNVPITLELLKQKSHLLSNIHFSSCEINCTKVSICIFNFDFNSGKGNLNDVLSNGGRIYGEYIRPECDNKYYESFAFHFMLSILMPKVQFDMKLVENGFSVLDMDELAKTYITDEAKVRNLVKDYKIQHQKDMLRFKDIVPSIATFFNVSEDFVIQRAEDLFLMNPFS